MGRRPKAWLMHGTGKRPGCSGYYVEYRERVGNRRVHRTRHFLSRKLAATYCRQYNARLDLRAVGEVPEISIGEALREFLIECAGLSDDSIGTYKAAVGWLSGHAVGVPVCRVTAAHVDATLRGRLRAGRKKKPSTPATVAKIKRALRRFFRWAMKRGYATWDPTTDSGVSLPSKSVRVRPIIGDRDVAAIIEHTRDPDCRVAVWLAATTGLDRRVIEELNAGQIDFEAGFIQVMRPKTRRIVVVPLHPTLALELRRRIEQGRHQGPLLRVPRHQSRKSDWFRRAREAAGRPDIAFRDLRAFATSRAVNARIPLAEVSRSLGHSSVAVTAAHYLLPNPETALALGRLQIPGYPAERELKEG